MPTLRGIWDTFPLLQSGAAGFVPMGPEPSFTSGCTHLEVGERDPVHSVLTTQNPLGKHGGDLSTLRTQQLRDLNAFLRSL